MGTILTSAVVAGAVALAFEFLAKPYLDARREGILDRREHYRELRATINRLEFLIGSVLAGFAGQRAYFKDPATIPIPVRKFMSEVVKDLYRVAEELVELLTSGRFDLVPRPVLELVWRTEQNVRAAPILWFEADTEWNEGEVALTVQNLDLAHKANTLVRIFLDLPRLRVFKRRLLLRRFREAVGRSDEEEKREAVAAVESVIHDSWSAEQTGAGAPAVEQEEDERSR